MVLKKVSVKRTGKGKPTRYRFKSKKRLGFRGKRVVEVAKFKKKK